ncbi:hypothetical protein AMK31_35450 [Streptomyces sp. TSRI0107]|nr:hypothetical protein AMK31_35450 [Streptomyces sp. TSRI0107]
MRALTDVAAMAQAVTPSCGVLVESDVSDFDILFDRSAAAEGAERIELPGGISLEAAAAVVETYFLEHPGAERLAVAANGVVLGVTTRSVVMGSFRGAPPVRLDECPECLGVGEHTDGCTAGSTAEV